MSGDDPRVAQLIGVELRRCRALEEGDVTTLREITDPSYRHVHGIGTVETYEVYLTRLSAGAEYRRIERSGLEVQIRGPVAVMTGTSVTTVQPSPEDARKRITGLALQVWVAEQAGWRHVAFQLTLTGPPVEIDF